MLARPYRTRFGRGLGAPRYSCSLTSCCEYRSACPIKRPRAAVGRALPCTMPPLAMLGSPIQGHFAGSITMKIALIGDISLKRWKCGAQGHSGSLQPGMAS